MNRLMNKVLVLLMMIVISMLTFSINCIAIDEIENPDDNVLSPGKMQIIYELMEDNVNIP